MVREGSPDPGGLPRYPLKAVIVVAFVLLLAQGVSQLLKDASALRQGDPGEREQRAGDQAPGTHRGKAGL